MDGPSLQPFVGRRRLVRPQMRAFDRSQRLDVVDVSHGRNRRSEPVPSPSFLAFRITSSVRADSAAPRTASMARSPTTSPLFQVGLAALVNRLGILLLLPPALALMVL